MLLFIDITRKLIQKLSKHIEPKKNTDTQIINQQDLQVTENPQSTKSLNNTPTSGNALESTLKQNLSISFDNTSLQTDSLIKLTEELKSKSDAAKILDISKELKGILKQNYPTNSPFYNCTNSTVETPQQVYEKAYSTSELFSLVGNKAGLETFLVSGKRIAASGGSSGEINSSIYPHAWNLVLMSDDSSQMLNSLSNQLSHSLGMFISCNSKLILVDIANNRIIDTKHPLAKLYLGDDEKPLYRPVG